MRDFTQDEKTILGCSAGSVVLSFFPWWKVSVEGGEGFAELMKGMGGSANAFDSVWGVLAFLACVATVGLLFAERSGALPWAAKHRLLAPVVSTGGATVFLLFFLTRTGGGAQMEVMGISAGRTMWYYLALLAMGFATWKAFQRWTMGAAEPPAPTPPLPEQPPAPPAP